MPYNALTPKSCRAVLGKVTPEQLSGAILRNPAFIVTTVDNRGVVSFFNAGAEKALGYSAAEIVGKRTPEIWLDAEEIRQYTAELSAELGAPIKPEIESLIKVRGDKPSDREWTFTRKDGSRFPAFSSSGPLKDEQGGIVGYMAISKDITQLRLQQRAILNHEIFLDTVIGHLGDGLITINDSCIVQNYNPACEELFGYKAAEVIGKNVSMLMPVQERDKYDDYLARYPRTDKKKIAGLRLEVKGLRKDGSLFPFDLSVNEFEIDGKVMFCGTIHDVSERNAALAERECLIERLTASNAEFERFAYVASHDMQEPLRTMNSFSELVLSEYQKVLDDEGKTYLNLIRDAAARMQALVVDLLEYARLGQGTMHKELFDAGEEYAHVLQDISASIARSGAKVSSDSLPQIKGDRVQFLRLLQNLIGNGLKYHRAGTAPEIHVRAEDKEDYWLFSISDNGIGIDSKHVTRIFEPFKRLHSQQEYAGTGLGLTVCKRIVENHSGKIWCVSTVGEGSIFYFTWLK